MCHPGCIDSAEKLRYAKTCTSKFVLYQKQYSIKMCVAYGLEVWIGLKTNSEFSTAKNDIMCTVL